jgi:hypothetical protein
MKIVIDIILKLIQIVLMPLILKSLDILFKYFQEKYKNDEGFRKRVDELLGKVTSVLGPKLMKMYLEHKMGSGKRDSEKKSKAEDKKRAAEKNDSNDVPNTEEDASDLVETATETARAGAQAAKLAAGKASKKASGFLRKARRWLEAETGINEGEPTAGEPNPPSAENPTPEDEEIARLKRRIDEEQADKQPATAAPNDPAKPLDQRAETPPTVPTKQPSNQNDDPSPQPAKHGDWNTREELLELLRKEREDSERDS